MSDIAVSHVNMPLLAVSTQSNDIMREMRDKPSAAFPNNVKRYRWAMVGGIRYLSSWGEGRAKGVM